MSEPGTAVARPQEWGAKLDDEWWSKTADALLRRLVGFAQGDGPPQDETERLSKGIQIIFSADIQDDRGERSVRGFLNSNNESSDILAVRLCDALAQRCGPYALRDVAQTRDPDGPDQPSAAVDSRRPHPSHQPKQQGRESKRPKPARPGEPSDWWQRWIDSQNANFEKEHRARVEIYEAYLYALDGSERETFAEDPQVQPNPILWQGRFKQAVSIALLGRGVAPFDVDDAYHLPSVTSVPAGLQSMWLLGELVHAAWQFQYLEAEPQSSVLAEYLYSAGEIPGSPDPFRGVLRDYREILTNDEEANWLGAAKWAFGKYRPDLVDFKKQAIFEIKPLRSAPSAVLQLWRYTHNFNCARYFDELTKAGSDGSRYFITPQPMPQNVFGPIDPTNFLEQYFSPDSEQAQVATGLKRIPSKRRRARRSEVERAIRAGRKLKVVPLGVSSLPGIVLYQIHDDQRSPDPDRETPPVTSTLTKIALVVTAVVIVTAIVVAIVSSAGTAGPAAAGVLASDTAAEVGAVGAGTAIQIESFGSTVKLENFDSTAKTITTSFDRLNDAGVLGTTREQRYE